MVEIDDIVRNGAATHCADPTPQRTFPIFLYANEDDPKAFPDNMLILASVEQGLLRPRNYFPKLPPPHHARGSNSQRELSGVGRVVRCCGEVLWGSGDWESGKKCFGELGVLVDL